MAACGSGGASDARYASFSLDPETCEARHPAGLRLLQSPAAPERLILSVETDEAAPLVLAVGDRPVLTTPLAPLDGWASTSFPDARVFWSAFGQADRLMSGAVSIPLADQAGLRDVVVACAYGTNATDGADDR